MRSLDNWNKYTDNDNKPLHGCIMFMVNLGNTVAPIYDKDGTPLNNPQLTDTYGRANAGSYGYAKVFFSLNDNGEYAVTQIYQHTGENFSTDGNIVEFKPGEYIWCPHTFETNASYGTWFMFPGPSAAGGMLEEGVVAEFIHYKNEIKD